MALLRGGVASQMAMGKREPKAMLKQNRRSWRRRPAAAAARRALIIESKLKELGIGMAESASSTMMRHQAATSQPREYIGNQIGEIARGDMAGE